MLNIQEYPKMIYKNNDLTDYKIVKNAKEENAEKDNGYTALVDTTIMPVEDVLDIIEAAPKKSRKTRKKTAED